MIRWLLVLPISLIAWVTMVVIGVFAHDYVQVSLCPPDDLISEFGNNDVVQIKAKWVLYFFAGLSAVAVVVAAALTAPANKVATAWTALGIGSLAAAVLGGMSPESLAALCGGTLAAAALTACYVRPKDQLGRCAVKP